MGWLRGWEWIIILVIVLLLFGVGRLGRLGAELGKGIRNFREALSGKGDASEGPAEEPKS